MHKFCLSLCVAGLVFCAFFVSANAAGESFFDHFGILNRGRWYISDGWANGAHQGCEWKRNALSIQDGALELKLSDEAGKTRPYTCPEIHTNDRFGYGIYEARMRIAAGSGLNTAFFTYVGPPTGSSQHDEIDAEFLGKNPHVLSAGLWVDGKGQPGKDIDLGFDASAGLHNYAIEWTPIKVRWYVDGKKMFETADGSPQPINPGRIYFSLWSGTQVEDSWMGPFRYTAPSKAVIAWTGFTPMGQKCLFPESMTCK